MQKINKIYRGLIYILPAVLFFSYWPWINFGANNTMNFDLSLPLIWLVLFDLLAFVMIVRGRKIKTIFKKWPWLLFPGFLTLSLIWSHDFLRGFLIVGVLWLLYFAVFSLVIFKDKVNDEKFKKNFFKIFFAISLLSCGWCVLQCVLDVAGVSSDYTLMCKGCVYKTFGFPHPNGFAAEPQFMGNLLLAPIIVSLYLLVNKKFFGRKSLLLMFFVFVATLFLTLSRGAIYAFCIAMICFTVMQIVKTKKWKVLLIWPIVLLASLFALNMQGVFSELSKTNDTYVSGVSKAINQLTLGIVDLGGSQTKKDNDNLQIREIQGEAQINEMQGEALSDEEIKNQEEGEVGVENAVFDGYVEVSTNSRVTMWKSALSLWSKRLHTMAFGVGIGSALFSIYENGLLDTSREIINNQYVSLLLETGIVGIILLIWSLWLVYKVFSKSSDRIMLFSLMIAYMVSALFFSGLPNVLHIYLLPAILMVTLGDEKSSYRK